MGRGAKSLLALSLSIAIVLVSVQGLLLMKDFKEKPIGEKLTELWRYGGASLMKIYRDLSRWFIEPVKVLKSPDEKLAGILRHFKERFAGILENFEKELPEILKRFKQRILMPPREEKSGGIWWLGGISPEEVYGWDKERKLPIAPPSGEGSWAYPLALAGMVDHSVGHKDTSLQIELTNYNYTPVVIVRKILVESEKGIITLAPPEWKAMINGKPLGSVGYFMSGGTEYEKVHGEPKFEDIYREDGLYIPVSKPPFEPPSYPLTVGIINWAPAEVGKAFWKIGKNYKVTIIYDGGMEEFLIMCIETPV